MSTHYKCVGCGIKLPRCDLESMEGKCPFCGTDIVDDMTERDQFVATTKKPKQRRWIEMKGAGGKLYYHNTETGEDRWTKPADVDAVKNEEPKIVKSEDKLKMAMLREERRIQAEQLGLKLPSPKLQRATKVPAASSSSDNNRRSQMMTEAESAEFVSAASFQGRREGFVYKNDVQGLGYYSDRGSAPKAGTSAHTVGGVAPEIGVLGAAMPLGGACTGVLAICTVYYLTSSNGHLPPGVSTPPISFLGCESPEHEAYQLGFAVTGLLLATCVRMWQVHVFPLMRIDFPTCAQYGLWGGYAASFGVIGQGVITLESGLVEKLSTGEPEAMQSTVHQSVAAFFFMGAAAHCYCITYAYWKISTSGASSTSDRSDHQQLLTLASSTKFAKAAFVGLSFAAGPIAQALHPAATGDDNRRAFGIAGLAQYLAVGSYICFFGTYTWDFLALRRMLSLKTKGE